MSELLSPLKSIRAKCLDCVCGNAKEITLCTAKHCPLYPYRFGKDVRRSQREPSEALTEAYMEILKKKKSHAL